MIAVQESPTSIQVSWTPSPSVRATTGYRIEYTSDGGSSDSVTVSGDTTTHLLEGLQSGETYTISIITISDESTSDPSMVVIDLNVTGHINSILRRHPLIIMYVPLCQVVEEGMEEEIVVGIVSLSLSLSLLKTLDNCAYRYIHCIYTIQEWCSSLNPVIQVSYKNTAQLI